MSTTFPWTKLQCGCWLSGLYAAEVYKSRINNFFLYFVILISIYWVLGFSLSLLYDLLNFFMKIELLLQALSQSLNLDNMGYSLLTNVLLSVMLSIVIG